MNNRCRQWALAIALAVMGVCASAQTRSGGGIPVRGTVVNQVGEATPAGVQFSFVGDAAQEFAAGNLRAMDVSKVKCQTLKIRNHVSE